MDSSVFNAVVYLKIDTATLASRMATLADNAEADSTIEQADKKALAKAASEAAAARDTIQAFATKYGI